MNILGGRNFFLGTYPDLGRLPLAAFEPTVAATGQNNYNDGLSDGIKSLAKALNGHDEVKVAVGDFQALFEAALQNPAKYGFTETKKSCLVGAYGETPARTLCPDPDHYLFW